MNRWAAAIVAALMLVFGVPWASAARDAAFPIPDPALEEAVRMALGNRSEAIQTETLLGLKTLDLSGRRIRSLEGLQYALNLETLDLSHNRIADIGNLTPLKKLKRLNLEDNRLTDVAALSGLTALADLNMSQNRIASLEPLAGLNNLMVLHAAYNRIRDLSPLRHLGRLDSLFLYGNAIEDVQALEALVQAADNRLLRLDVRGNPLRSAAVKELNAWKRGAPMDLFFDPLQAPAYGSDLLILIDGEPQAFSRDARIIGGRAFVPMRGIFEKLGYALTWDKGKIHAYRSADPAGGIRLEIGSLAASVDGKAVKLEAKPVLQDGVTLVPLRFVVEHAGAEVVWEPTARAVIVKTPDGPAFAGDGWYVASGASDFRLLTAAGNTALPGRYLYAEPYVGGLSVVMLQDGNWAVINLRGETLFRTPFRLTGLSEGRVAFRSGERWGYFDLSGSVVVEADYDQAEPFRDGKANVIFQGRPMTVQK